MSVAITLAPDGPSAPPRLNGELAFDTPWQSRIFGLTAALVEDEALSWPAMQAALIERVAAADAAGNDGSNTQYWTCWLEAVSLLLTGTGVIGADVLDAAAEDFANRSAH